MHKYTSCSFLSTTSQLILLFDRDLFSTKVSTSFWLVDTSPFLTLSNCYSKLPKFRTAGATKRHACQNSREQEKREKREQEKREEKERKKERKRKKRRENLRRREQYEISEEESSRLGNIPRRGSFVAQKTLSENIALKRFTKTAIKQTGSR